MSRYDRFYEVNGPPIDCVKDERAIAELSDAPELLLELWREHGFCGWRRGLIWVCDPRPLMLPMSEWFPDGRRRLPYARTAFGDVFFWDGESTQLLDVEYGRITRLGGKRMDIVFWSSMCDAGFLDNVLGAPLFDEALGALGPIAADECFAFKLPLTLGGRFVLDNLAKVKLRERLSILARSANPDVVVDGVEFSARTDFSRLARGIVAGSVGGSLRSDCGPMDWWDRVEPHLAGTPWLDRITREFAGMLDQCDSRDQAEVLHYFSSRPQAAGAERVEDLAENSRARFSGDSEQALLRALAARLSAGSERARLLARRIAMEPGKAGALAATLAGDDSEWTVANAEEIVRGTPGAAVPILMHLDLKRPDHAALAERLAPLADRDPDFRRDAERFLEDAEAKRRIFAALNR